MVQKLIILLFSLCQICFSQALPEPSFYTIERPEDSGEEIVLETDRQFYCIDERIYFTAGYKFKYPIDDVQWSHVLYVEFIRWNGEKIVQAKFKLDERGASGYITIPNTLLSGNYYLRAYTKWMRNFPVADYSYKLIKVINPFESKVDIGSNGDSDNHLLRLEPAKGNSSESIECFTEKSNYKQREKVNLTLLLKNQDLDDSNFCISVAKAASLDTNRSFHPIPDNLSTGEKTFSYLPECRGISITGKILNANAPLSVANTTLHLSSLQNSQYFSTFHTRENGLFYFTLPDFYGQCEFYIDAVLENGENAEILVDNDYCNRTVKLDYIPFALDSAEKNIALEMTVNMQLSNMYSDPGSMGTPASSPIPFYVHPNQVYYTEEYIELPNLEEFFYELVPEVRTVTVKKQAYLKLVAYSEYQDLMPLILLDNIPVVNVDEFLKIPLDKIQKLEIIDRPYIVSGEKYSGIISASTKRKDFAGIDLNKNSLFFNYDLLSDGHFKMPDYSIPDTTKAIYMNNVLFWEPDITLKPDQIKTLSFYTSDSQGEYLVYIRSLRTGDQSQVFGTCKIVVE